MATSESDIRTAVSLLLRQYGSLTTSEVKELLNTVMPFDNDDMQPSRTRAEPLITQRIGNIVSHQKEDIRVYDETYVIDKTVRPATWSILVGLQSQNTLDRISDEDVQRRKERRRSFKPQQIDWQALNHRRTELGRLGEEFVMRYETNNVFQFAPNDLERVIHLSEEQGDGAGFDIMSLNQDGTDRYIEVKTTQGGVDTPFYMTENERAYFELNRYENSSFIYRVFNFDVNTRMGNIIVISAEELFSMYSFDPVSYKVSRMY